MLEVLVPGAGHYALGAPKQAAFWLGAACAPWLFVVGAALVGSLPTFWSSFIVFLLARVTAGLHCLFVAKRPLPSWRKVLMITAALGLTIAGVVTTAKLQCIAAFRIASNSMYPALKSGDYIMISRWNRAPRRGDIVAYRPPAGGADAVHVMRVVALAGDTVRVSDSLLFVNGKQLTTSRRLGTCPSTAECELLQESIEGATYPVMLLRTGLERHDSSTTIVPTGSAFVLGDNRDSSDDSRSFGPIPLQSIVGRFQFTWFSPEAWQG